jgi:hypothetical protein
VVQDYYSDVDPAGQNIQVLGQPWVHHFAKPPVSQLSGPNFVVVGQTNYEGPHLGADPVEQAVPVAIPALGSWGVGTLVMTLVALGAAASRRLPR